MFVKTMWIFSSLNHVIFKHVQARENYMRGYLAIVIKLLHYYYTAYIIDRIYYDWPKIIRVTEM